MGDVENVCDNNKGKHVRVFANISATQLLLNAKVVRLLKWVFKGALRQIMGDGMFPTPFTVGSDICKISAHCTYQTSEC